MKITRKILSLVLAAAMLLSLSVTAFAMTTDSENKIITVSSGDSIQDAIDMVAAMNESGWTIEIESGTYDRFYVSSKLEGLTITAAKGATVFINVLDGNTNEAEIYGAVISGSGACGNQCCLIRGTDITISNLVFNYLGKKVSWMDTAIGIYTEGAVRIDNCVFDGDYTGVGGVGYGVFIQNKSGSVSVTNCQFDTLDQAIWGENASRWPIAMNISNNTFKNCSFAVHFGYNSGDVVVNQAVDTSKVAEYDTTGNYFNLINNYVVGTEELRNKVVLQDSYDADMCSFTISGNTLAYGLVGLVNIADTTGEGYQLTSDVLADNTFGESSFYVDASYDYAGGKENVAVYMASETSSGQWVLTGADGLKNKDFYPLVEAAVEAVNEAGSNKLQITGLEGYEDVLYTFTWYKDAIYWEGESTKTSYPGLEKWIDLGDEWVKEDTIAAGDIVDFVLVSNVPEDLTNYLEPDEAGSPSVLGYDSELNSGTYLLAFHDNMDADLELDESSIVLTVNDKVVTDTDLYTVLVPGDTCEDGCTFEVVMNVVGLFNAGYFTEDDFGTASIVVTYSATASDDLAPGEYLNTSWVVYEGGETPEDTVVVVTYGLEIFKYDQATGEGLYGAEFVLYKAVDYGELTDEVIYMLLTGDVDTSDESTLDNILYLGVGDKVAAMTSAADGYCILDGLDAGYYFLYETSAPDGYVKSDDYLFIQIPEDADETTYVVSTEFANAEIPHTGGTGTMMYTVGGVAVLTAAAVLFVVSRKKKAED